MLRCVHAVRAAGGAEAGVLPGVAECRLGTLWLVGWTHPSPSSTCFFFFCPVHAVPAVPVVVVWTPRGCAAAAAAVGRCRGGALRARAPTCAPPPDGGVLPGWPHGRRAGPVAATAAVAASGGRVATPASAAPIRVPRGGSAGGPPSSRPWRGPLSILQRGVGRPVGRTHCTVLSKH